MLWKRMHGKEVWTHMTCLIAVAVYVNPPSCLTESNRLKGLDVEMKLLKVKWIRKLWENCIKENCEKPTGVKAKIPRTPQAYPESLPSRSCVPSSRLWVHIFSGTHPSARSLKLAHHSFNKVQHFSKICGTDATRAINQEHDVLVLRWTL